MQYTISLPAAYDMENIRKRVAARCHLTDGFSGLGLKAYLIRERGIGGSLVNVYAPFYLWSSAKAMGRFLWGGGGFGSIVADFGRPVVRQWTGVQFITGGARLATPRFASITLREVPKDADPQESIQKSLELLQARRRLADVHSAALAVDPFHWQIATFTLWEGEAPDDSEAIYEVLHLSHPSIDEL